MLPIYKLSLIILILCIGWGTSKPRKSRDGSWEEVGILSSSFEESSGLGRGARRARAADTIYYENDHLPENQNQDPVTESPPHNVIDYENDGGGGGPSKDQDPVTESPPHNIIDFENDAGEPTKKPSIDIFYYEDDAKASPSGSGSPKNNANVNANTTDHLSTFYYESHPVPNNNKTKNKTKSKPVKQQSKVVVTKNSKSGRKTTPKPRSNLIVTVDRS